MAQRIVIPGFRKIETRAGGEGGISNYEDLTNKPSVNNVPLVGNMNTSDLHLTDKTLTESDVPADAKQVGDKFESQSNVLESITESLQNLETSMGSVSAEIGDIDTLQTQVKDSLVHAINWLNAQFTLLKGKVTELENKIGE